MLSTYLTDTMQLLYDTNYSFVSRAQVIRWINEARRNAAKRTGCIRRLITGQSAFGASSQPGFAIPGAMQPGMIPDAFPQGKVASGGDFNADFNADFSIGKASGNGVAGAVLGILQTIPGVERYPYVGFFNPVLQAEHAGCDKVIDAISLSVNWGGVSRPTLDWMPWDNLQAYCRAYAVLVTSYPSVWSVYNDGPQGEIWMFPVPSQAGEIELDAAVTPTALLTDADFDAIPEGFREAIKFGAAAMVFLSSRRYADAQVFENMFADAMGVARVAVDGGKSSSYYWPFP